MKYKIISVRIFFFTKWAFVTFVPWTIVCVLPLRDLGRAGTS